MKRTFIILLFSSFLVPQALAEEPPIPPPLAPALEAPVRIQAKAEAQTSSLGTYDRETIIEFASTTAALYGINPTHLINVIENESHWSNNQGRPSPTGDYGYCQINYASWHKEITMAQMLDPYWCIPWMAKAWAAGHASWWTQWRILYG